MRKNAGLFLLSWHNLGTRAGPEKCVIVPWVSARGVLCQDSGGPGRKCQPPNSPHKSTSGSGHVFTLTNALDGVRRRQDGNVREKRDAKRGGLSVDFPAVSDPDDQDDQFPVLNRVDNAPIPDADASVTRLAFQHLHAGRPWIVGQGVNVGLKAGLKLRSEPKELAACGG